MYRSIVISFKTWHIYGLKFYLNFTAVATLLRSFLGFIFRIKKYFNMYVNIIRFRIMCCYISTYIYTCTKCIWARFCEYSRNRGVFIRTKLYWTIPRLFSFLFEAILINGFWSELCNRAVNFLLCKQEIDNFFSFLYSFFFAAILKFSLNSSS